MLRRTSITIVALVAALTVTTTAEARTPRTDCQNKALKESYSAHWFKVRKLHGKRAPGRNIRKWGMTPKRHSTCKDLRKSRATLRRMTFQGSALLTAGSPYVPPAGTATLSAASPPLSAIAQCESGGNPRAVGGGGAFRGKYQFTYQTWASVGGSGDPAAASEAEQDQRAAMLYAREGARPWPVCGR